MEDYYGDYDGRGGIPVGSGMLLCFLLGLFFVMLLATSLVSQIIGRMGLEPRTQYLLISSVQAVLAFILPAWITARMQSRTPAKKLCLDVMVSWKPFVGIAVLYLIAQPLMNQIIFWNESMTFPESMAGFEHSIREMEDNSAKITAVLLGDSSIWGMLSGILVVGILTGFAEELFFRDGLQRLLMDKMNRHAAIWTAAVVFSVLHFQFYGFVPRILLGAFFGYLFVWTGSIWVPAFAHALNNSIVVVMEWLRCNHLIASDYTKFGVSESGFPVWFILSLLIVAVFFWKGTWYFFSESKR